MLVIDTFPFFNELDMLEYRLNVLKDVVDYFVLVESTKTHSGKDKPLFYNENKQRFSDFHSKIIHVIADTNIPDGPDAWTRERWQRNQADQGIKTLNLEPNDLILVNDLDEIPNPEVLKKIKQSGLSFPAAMLKQVLYYYNIETFVTDNWIHPKLISYKYYVDVLEGNPDNIRLNFTLPIITFGGWHLSYFGDENFIANKIKNFAHQEYNNEKYTNIDHIKECLNTGKDVFRRMNYKNVPINENKFQPAALDLLLRLFPIRT